MYKTGWPACQLRQVGLQSTLNLEESLKKSVEKFHKNDGKPVTGATGVVKELGVYDGTVPIVGRVDGVGVDRLGNPLDKLKEGEPIVGIAVGTAPPSN